LLEALLSLQAHIGVFVIWAIRNRRLGYIVSISAFRRSYIIA
jgi:hypothetical protein